MHHNELIIDSFAGGGGASTGIEMALGRSPDYAINHDAQAIAMHRANHPDTIHLNSNIYQIDPLDVVGKRPLGLLWASPDCKHFSKAKGGKPVKRNIRDLAWTIVLWAKRARPRVIMMENVEEFRTWGPLTADQMPCPDRKGETFDKWVRELRRLGYKVEWRELRACDYDVPTIRKRLFVIARRDGQPIVWTSPTHGKPDDPAVLSGAKLPYHTAAEIIDWSLPCPSIFDTAAEIKLKYGLRAQRPLADATMARIARGVKRYVLDAAQPFIVTCNHGGDWQRGWSIDEPIKTMTAARDAHALVTPTITPFIARTDMASAAARNGIQPLDEATRTQTTSGSFAFVAPKLTPFVSYAQQGGHNRSAEDPLHTITASAKDQNCIIAPTLIETGYGERVGQQPRAPGLSQPIGTQVSGGGKHAVVAAFLAKHNTGATGSSMNEPVHTITANGFGKRPGGAAPVAVIAANMLSLRGSARRDAAMDAPLNTISAGGNHAAIVAAHISRQFGQGTGSAMDKPIGTITANGAGKAAIVAAFLQKYYGTGGGAALDEPTPTDSTRDRFSLVTVEIDGQTFVIEDIGMRMLTPRERFRAQGFPDSYIIENGIDENGNQVRLSQSAQGRMCGNSVCPGLAKALVAANVPELSIRSKAA